MIYAAPMIDVTFENTLHPSFVFDAVVLVVSSIVALSATLYSHSPIIKM